jgi:hypothetical protein
MNDLDYVELFSKKIKNDHLLFEQQKKIIESQLKGSSSLFTNMFADGDFKVKAREYLKSRKLI